MKPKQLITVGFALVLFGFVAPFLMVMRIVESTFLMNFLSYTASVGGLFMGIIGAAMYARMKRG
jgi:hypothetical protein